MCTQSSIVDINADRSSRYLKSRRFFLNRSESRIFTLAEDFSINRSQPLIMAGIRFNVFNKNFNFDESINQTSNRRI